MIMQLFIMFINVKIVSTISIIMSVCQSDKHAGKPYSVPVAWFV